MTYRDAVKAAEDGIAKLAVTLVRHCTPLPGGPACRPEDVASAVRPHVESLMIFLFSAAAAQVAEKSQAQGAMILAIAQVEYEVSPQQTVSVATFFRGEVPAEALLRGIYDGLRVKPAFEDHAVATLEISQRLLSIVELIKSWTHEALNA